MARASRAFTLVEVLVGLILCVMVSVIGFQLVLLLSKGEQGLDRDAQRALVESRMMQAVLSDLRSSVQVQGQENDYRITRLVSSKGKPLEKKEVRWKRILVTGPPREVVRFSRECDGKTDVFELTGTYGLNKDTLRLQIDKVSDVTFTP